MKVKKSFLMTFFIIGIFLFSNLINSDVGYLNVPNSTTNNSIYDFQSIANKTLSEQIIIPTSLENFARYLFALDNTSPIELQTFIIYFSFWIMFLFLIKSALEVIPLFGTGWKSWLGSIIVTILISSTGSLKDIAIWFFSLGKLFKQTSFLWLILDFLILVLLFIGISILLKKVKSNIGEEKARTIGMKTSMP